MKSCLNVLRILMIIVALGTFVDASATGVRTPYYRTFRVSAMVKSGSGSVYFTTQTETTNTEYVKFDTALEDGFACTLSDDFGRLFVYSTPDEGYEYEGVKVFTVGQNDSKPTDAAIEAAPFVKPTFEFTQLGCDEVMVFPGKATGSDENAKSKWSPYGVYGGTDYKAAYAVTANAKPDAYLYVYFRKKER